MGAFQFVAGWWGRQPGRRAVGGVPPPTISLAVRQIEMRPLVLPLPRLLFWLCYLFL